MKHDNELFQEMSDDQVRQALVATGIRICLLLLTIIGVAIWLRW